MLGALDHGRTVGFLGDMDDTFHPQQTRAEVLLQSVEQQAQRFTRDRLLAHEAERRDVAVMQAVVMIVMNVVYAAIAFPAGAAADRLGARGLLIAGLAVLVAADIVLAGAVSPLPVLAGAALWGIHMGLTQGLLSKLVADTAPENLLGTAFGVFNLASGVALLLASVIAGALWSGFGAQATFLAGAAFAAVAALGLAAQRPRDKA